MSNPIHQDKVPATMAEAVDLVIAGMSGADKESGRSVHPSRLHFGFGMAIRNNWSFWEWDTPIKNDCIETYKIAHADDMSGLLLAWVAAKLKGEAFDPVAYCERFHEHWRRECGQTSIEAGTPDKHR